MTSPSTMPDQLEQLDIKLATLGGLDLKSVRQLLTVITSAVTFAGATNLGKNVGLTANERLVSLVIAGAVIGIYILAKSLHHAAIEKGNAAVKVAAIQAATAQSTPVVLDSPPDAQTLPATDTTNGRHVAPDPATEDPTVPQPPDVGVDLPIETVSTTLPTGDAGHLEVSASILLGIVTFGVFLGGLILHLVLTH